jgi:tetratricopeptide (TPR) repeat protein
MKSDRPRDLYLRALIGRAKTFQFTGQYENSIRDYRCIKKNVRDSRQLFDYYCGLSSVFEQMGQYRKAIALIEKAIYLSRRNRGHLNESMLRNVRVHLLIQKGDFFRALKLAYAVLRKTRRAALKKTERTSLYASIGNASMGLGDYAGALRSFQKVLKMHLRSNNLEGVSAANNNLTLVYWKMGKYREALEHARESLAVREKIGHVHGISSSLNNIGLINDEMGNYREALPFYEKALESFQRLNNVYGMTIALTNIGSIHHEILGNFEKAFEYYEKSYQYARQTGDPVSEADGLLVLASIQWRMGESRRYAQTVAALGRLMPGIQSVELSAMYELARIKLEIREKSRSGMNVRAAGLFKLLSRVRNDLLTMECVAALVDIVYESGLTGFPEETAPVVVEMEKGLPAVESPLKRTKVLRALVKYHLLANDPARAGIFFKEWEDVSKRFGIDAEAGEIERLRIKVKIPFS